MHNYQFLEFLWFVQAVTNAVVELSGLEYVTSVKAMVCRGTSLISKSYLLISAVPPFCCRLRTVRSKSEAFSYACAGSQPIVPSRR